MGFFTNQSQVYFQTFQKEQYLFRFFVPRWHKEVIMSQTYLFKLLSGSVLLLGVVSSVCSISVEKYLTMTSSQKNVLDQFREKVEPIITTSYMKLDTYLIQWLRARNFDIDSAEAMLRENIKWRKENGIDEMKNEDWSDISPDFHATFDTYDKTGRPIVVIDIYDWDIRRSVLQGKGKRGLRYVMSRVENVTGQVYERQEKLGMNVTQIVVLGNAEGFNVIQHGCPVCLSLWIQFVQYIENYYPEVLDELIIIEATPAIQVVLEAIRPFLTRSNREAIKVFGTNKAKWMPYLDNKISKEERRERYGGTRPPVKY
ncbi:SEC14-like protein 2 [Orchesella cincta]|uniref:SEC14-like protein 2 n=1 Tax=Orchesella cincta TaxID=48709 RepID=A0A1D2MB26_ORCCI|nr:SEC14-like protein 2 [Orchesella cincta]